MSEKAEPRVHDKPSSGKNYKNEKRRAKKKDGGMAIARVQAGLLTHKRRKEKKDQGGKNIIRIREYRGGGDREARTKKW